MPPRDIDPRAWGPDTWRTLHRVTLAYPVAPSDAERDAAHALFASLRHVLPCATCRQHYTAHFDSTFERDDAAASRERLSRWLHALHEKVNARLGKPSVRFEDLRRLYGFGAGGDDDAGALQATFSTVPPRDVALIATTAGALLVMVAVIIGASVALATRKRNEPAASNQQ